MTEQTQVAQELNNAMGGLRNSIQDQGSVRQDSKYVNEITTNNKHICCT